MNWKMLVVIGLICIGIGIVGVSILHHSAKADEAASCVAGPGEICPSADFKLELKNLKVLADRQRDLAQNPKVKELIEIMDTQRGMSERMQGEINQTLQANPGLKWDGVKEKFVPGPPAIPTPAPMSTPPPPKK